MDGHDLLYGVPQSEIERIKAEGVKHEKDLLKSQDRIILTVAKNENYMDNPQVMDLLSKGYTLEKKLALACSFQLVFQK